MGRKREVYIDFGNGSAASTFKTWNSATAPTVTGTKVANLLDSDGDLTNWSLSLTTTFFSATIGTNGMEVAGVDDASWVDEAVITDTSWIANSSSDSVLEVAGLTPGKSYTVKIFGSRSNGVTGDYILNIQPGGTLPTGSLDVGQNTSRIYKATVAPDQNGKIVIVCDRGGTQLIGHLSAMAVIEERPEGVDGGFKYVGGATANGAAGTLSITHGVDIRDGDLVVAYANCNSVLAFTPGADGGAPWVEEIDEQPDSTETSQHALYWKIANGEPATYTWSAGNAQWQVVLQVFRTRAGASISVGVAASSSYQPTGTNALQIQAQDGDTLPAGALSVVAGGKDNRDVLIFYDTVDNSYQNIIGVGENQMAAMCHRIWTAGGAAPATITVTDASWLGPSDASFSIHIAFVSTYPYPDGVVTFGDDTVGTATSPGSGDRAVVSKFRSNYAGQTLRGYAHFDIASDLGASAKLVIYTSDRGEPGTLVAVSSGGVIPEGGGLIDLGTVDARLYNGQDYFVGVVYSDFQANVQVDSAASGFVSRLRSGGGMSYSSPPSTWPGTDVSYTNIQVNVWVDVLVDSQQVRVPIITRLPKRWTKKPPFGTPIDRSYPLCRDLTLVDPMQTPMPYDILQRHLPFASDPSVPMYGGPVLGVGQYYLEGGGARRRYNPVAIDGRAVRGIPELTAAAIFRMRTPEAAAGPSTHEWINCYRSGFTNWRLGATRNSGDIRKFNWTVYDTLDVNHTAQIANVYAVDDAKVHTMVGTFKQNETLDVYLDGDQKTVGTPFNDTINTETSPAMAVQAEHTNSQSFNDDVYLVCVWLRCLSDAEVRSFIANPWQIFTPQTPQLAKVANRRLVVR